MRVSTVASVVMYRRQVFLGGFIVGESFPDVSGYRGVVLHVELVRTCRVSRDQVGPGGVLPLLLGLVAVDPYAVHGRQVTCGFGDGKDHDNVYVGRNVTFRPRWYHFHVVIRPCAFRREFYLLIFFRDKYFLLQDSAEERHGDRRCCQGAFMRNCSLCFFVCQPVR